MRLRSLTRALGSSRASSSIMGKPPESTHPNRAAFPPGVSGPALRALAGAGVRSVTDLGQWSEEELGALHGLGPKALTVLRDALVASGRKFRGS